MDVRAFLSQIAISFDRSTAGGLERDNGAILNLLEEEENRERKEKRDLHLISPSR